jgi:hypothetical protein
MPSCAMSPLRVRVRRAIEGEAAQEARCNLGLTSLLPELQVEVVTAVKPQTASVTGTVQVVLVLAVPLTGSGSSESS